MTQKTLKDYLSLSQQWLKKASTRSKVFALCAVVGCAALVLGIVFGFNALCQRDLRALYAQASQIDKVIVHIDEVLTVGLTSNSPRAITSTKKELIVAQRQVNDAVKEAEKLSKKASKKERAHIELVQNSLGVRAYILSLAPELLDDNLKAANALNDAEVAWKSLESGVRKNQEAQKLQAAKKPDDLKRANKHHREALEDYSQAQDSLAKAAEAMTEADFSAYNSYIQSCIDLSQAAIEANDALLNNKKDRAKVAVKKYNKVSKDAAILAHQGLKPLNSVIMTAYKIKTKELSSQYFSAREKVSSIDKQIR